MPVDIDPALVAIGAFGDDPCANNRRRWTGSTRSCTGRRQWRRCRSASRGGRGISVGQPDSGYTLHPNLGAAGLDLNRDRDVIDGDDDALDDLIPNPAWPLPNPGHGTATASVIVGQGTPPRDRRPGRQRSSGADPRHRERGPGIRHQCGEGGRTRPAGGLSRSDDEPWRQGFFGLKGEIQRAVDAGMIVMAAAGNYVQIVTAPASYDNCLAVAATGPGDTLWVDSSRGTAVDVSMPGSCVYVAAYRRQDPRRPDGQRHLVRRRTSGGGRRVVAGASRPPVVDQEIRGEADTGRLSHNLALAGRVRRTAGVGSRLRRGSGRSAGFVAGALPEPRDLVEVGAFGASQDDAVARIAAMISADPVRVRTRLAELLKVSTPEELNQTIAEHEGELLYLVLADRAFAESLAQPGSIGAFAPRSTSPV